MKINNLHVVLNNFVNDSRVLKELYSISSINIFNEIHIVALHDPGLKEYEKINANIYLTRIKLNSRRLYKMFFFQVFKYLEWVICIFWRYRNMNLRLVHCHDLSALPVGVLFKILKGVVVIYDCHELESERNGFLGFHKLANRFTERVLIKFADKVVLVSPSILEWYKKEYHRNDLLLVRNIPNIIMQSGVFFVNIKKLFNLSSDDIIFIYQGGLFKGRGVEKILEVFANVGKNRHILFLGSGSLQDLVLSFEKKHNNIHFHSHVPPAQVMSIVSQADVGLCLIENTCLSYRFSLPNKLFEYLLSGLPVVINCFPDQKEIVEQYKCGWIAPSKAEELVNFINKISKQEIFDKKKNLTNISKLLSWDGDFEKVINFYKEKGV